MAIATHQGTMTAAPGRETGANITLKRGVVTLLRWALYVVLVLVFLMTRM